MKPSGTALCSLTLVLLGCTEGGNPPRAAAPGEPLLETRCETVATSTDPALTIGHPASDAAVAFGRPVDAALLPDGGIAVIDAFDNTLSVFDSTGARIARAGGEGEGPGEFVSPASVHVSGDTIIVWDRRLRRLSHFDLTGSFLHTRPLPSNASRSIIGPFADGSLVEHRGTPFGFGELVRDTLIVEHHPSLAGDAVREIGRFPASTRYADLSRGMSVYSVPFHPQTSIDGWPDQNLLVIGAADSASVLLVPLDGRDPRRIPVPLEGAEVDDSLIAAWRRADPVAAELMRDVAFPDRAPAYRSVHADAAGLLWVMAEPLPGENGRHFAVLRDDGELIEELRFRGEVELMSANEHRVLLRRLGALDVQYFEVYERDCGVSR